MTRAGAGPIARSHAGTASSPRSPRLLRRNGVNQTHAREIARVQSAAMGDSGGEPGSAVLDPKLVAARDLARIESLARQYAEIVKKTRAEMHPARP